MKRHSLCFKGSKAQPWNYGGAAMEQRGYNGSRETAVLVGPSLKTGTMEPCNHWTNGGLFVF